MNLHEYQAKKLFAAHGIPVCRGIAVRSADEAAQAVESLEGDTWAVKAQVHAGGRGRAGGVKLVRSAAQAHGFADDILGTRLVTGQTDATGQPVNCLYVEECVAIAREFYLGAVIDRSARKIVFMASTEGGVDIEEVAARTPHLIVRVGIDPLIGAHAWQGRQFAFDLGLAGPQMQQFTDLFMKLAGLFEQLDCSLLEVNPLALTETGNIICLDAKINIDENALFRHSGLEELRDFSQENPLEVDASRHGLNYVALDGDIGCMVNGAGLAMGTMDLVKAHGGNPANFLDVGGGATPQAVAEAFRIILSDGMVKVVFINIFGGIVSCATIAEGIIAAVRNISVKVPVVVRFEGNNADQGRARLDEAGLDIIAINDIAKAAGKAVEIAAETP